MVHSSHRDELSRLVERLVEVEPDRARERLLLETIVRSGWAQAATLYRRSSNPSAWVPVLSRGPADLLPAAALVEAIDRGEFPPELPLGGAVLFAGEAERGVALALGGAGDEEVIDRLGALVEVVALLGPPRGEVPSLDADLLHPPLPESDAGASPHEERLRLLEEDEGRDETAA